MVEALMLPETEAAMNAACAVSSRAQVFGRLVLIAVSIEPVAVQADSTRAAADTMISVGFHAELSRFFHREVSHL